jgi:uncharacterized spore protein YtfJ
MTINYDITFDKVLSHLKELIKTEVVVGKPFKLDEFDCVPVIKIGVGFGSGGAIGKIDDAQSGKGLGGGSGAGVGISPIGFLASRGDRISFISTSGKSQGLDAVFEKIPEVLDKFIQMKQNRETVDKEKK